MKLGWLLDNRAWGVVIAVVGTAALTALLAPFRTALGLLNVGLLYLLLTLVLACLWGWRVGLLAALLANLLLDYFFIEPLHRLNVEEPRNLFALFVFFVVSMIVGWLIDLSRRSAHEADLRRAEAAALLNLSRGLIGATSPEAALAALCGEALRAFRARGAAVLSAGEGAWEVRAAEGEDAGRAMDATERSTAETALRERHLHALGWTGLRHSRAPRYVTGGRGGAQARSVAFAPLFIGEEALGVLRLDGPLASSSFAEAPERLLEAFAREAALSLQRVRLAQEAAHADALRQADAMKSALLASVSHDLRTPLAGITTAVSSLNDRSVAWSEADRDAFLRAIETQARLLDSIIGDILNLSRIESGVISPLIESVPVVDILAAARERSAMATQGRDVRIEAAPEVEVRTDESLIVQALVNLIENAAKYSQPGGAIALAARALDGEVEISVADAGPGIAAEDLPHLFERFYRGQQSARRTRGSGLGLSIVKGFVTLSGGAVRVETSADGTRFTLTLPAGRTAVPA